MLVNVVSPQWELHKAGWEKSAMAQLHKWAFYWANQSGSPRFGLLPRKHSLEGVSPYPCAWTERSQYYHYPALTLSPPLSFFLCFLLMLFLVSSSWSRSTLLPSSFLFFAFSTSPSPRMICYSLHTLQLNRLPSESCDLRRHVISSPLIGCMPLKSVVTVSYYIVYLPGGGSSRTVTIFKSARSGMATAPCLASLGWYILWFIMSAVIPVSIGLRMRTRWRKLSWTLRCLWQGINRSLL